MIRLRKVINDAAIDVAAAGFREIDGIAR